MHNPDPGWTNPLDSNSAQIWESQDEHEPLVCPSRQHIEVYQQKHSHENKRRDKSHHSYSSLIRQHLENCTRLLLTKQSGSAEGQQYSQGIQQLPCEIRLLELGSLSLEGVWLWTNPIAAYQCLRGVTKKAEHDRVHNGSIRGNNFEIREVSARNKEEKLIMRLFMRVLEQVAQ